MFDFLKTMHMYQSGASNSVKDCVTISLYFGISAHSRCNENRQLYTLRTTAMRANTHCEYENYMHMCTTTMSAQCELCAMHNKATKETKCNNAIHNNVMLGEYQ